MERAFWRVPKSLGNWYLGVVPHCPDSCTYAVSNGGVNRCPRANLQEVLGIEFDGWDLAKLVDVNKRLMYRGQSPILRSDDERLMCPQRQSVRLGEIRFEGREGFAMRSMDEADLTPNLPSCRLGLGLWCRAMDILNGDVEPDESSLRFRFC